MIKSKIVPDGQGRASEIYRPRNVSDEARLKELQDKEDCP